MKLAVPKPPQVSVDKGTQGVNQSLQSALVVVTVAKYVNRPIYSNDPANRASDYQARHAVMAVMPAGCIE